MTQHVAIESRNTGPSQVLSRRQVMLGAAGLTFAVALGVERPAAAGVAHKKDGETEQ